MIKYLFLVSLFVSQCVLSMENTQSSKLGEIVKENSLDRFRPKNQDEELNLNQEVAFRENTPRKRLRYALLKKILEDNATCVVEVGNRNRMTAGRTLPLQDIYVRTSVDKLLGNKIILAPEEIKPFTNQTSDNLVLLKVRGTTYQWVKITKTFPDDQYAVLINQKHGIICPKNELFTLINEPTIMNSSSTP